MAQLTEGSQPTKEDPMSRISHNIGLAVGSVLSVGVAALALAQAPRGAPEELSYWTLAKRLQ
jgi:hypothetical protein